ncbi:hypothetical protein L0F51_07020 [Afifella sp. H1R]|uniref:bestrophin-like domain n=1 Tax=Afifella sp. H1R TaxID=2908841 RepID=UPI001F2FBBAC|nr:hypothetical protein [Afifella sp. H1R]MCF1503510.1 hypothetical protein [Afifella sp. H1R]
MIGFVPAPLMGLIVVVGTVAIAFASYFLARTLLSSRGPEDSKDLAGSVVIRVSALHGLILALVFAQELANFDQIGDGLSTEAALIGDVFYDLERFDADITQKARDDLATYTGIVLNEELPALADGEPLLRKAWESWDDVYDAILDLEPQNVRQVALKPLLIKNVHEISQLRLKREEAAEDGVNGLFMLAALLGVALTAAAYFAFPPTVPNLLLLSIFGTYTGLIVFFVIAFAYPYSEPGEVRPVELQKLYVSEMQGRLPDQSSP